MLVTPKEDERAKCVQRLAVIEATFDPLPITTSIAREWGALAAAVRQRGGQPRRRSIDLAIAATAKIYNLPLLTHNSSDFRAITDLAEIHEL